MEALQELLGAGEVSLWAMFVVSFLAATVLPIGSEPLLVALVRMHPEQLAAIVAVATVGNTLGGMTSYGLGRGAARMAPGVEGSRVAGWLRRFGAPALLLAWLPIGGDLLCGVAGFMRLSWWQCALWMALGKLARYWLLAAGTLMI